MSPHRPVTLCLATTNADKVREVQRLLEGTPVRLVGVAGLTPVPAPDETEATFEANARLKALHYDARLAHEVARQTPGGRPDGRPSRVLTLGEDSGLEIDALGREPGVRSARFLRADATYPERFDEIYRRLRLRPEASRAARFRCAIAVVEAGQVCFETTATVEGLVAPAPRGTGGFGYDPVFWFPPLGATLAEVPAADKLAISHRGQAFRALTRWLDSQCSSEG